MKINICFASDNNYVQHLCVALVSILKNVDDDDELSFFIFDGGINDNNKNKILELKKIKDFNIEYINIDCSVFKDMPNYSNYISSVTYSRFKISSLLPDMDKIIYLDCDIVVCDSLKELFDENIEDYHIAGVEDIGYYLHRRALKRETESFYINAGIILMNLKKWRQDNIEEKLLSFALTTKEKLVHADQDIINMVLNKTCKPLNLKWNVQDSFFRVSTYIEKHPLKKYIKRAWLKPAIVHYTGEQKPWNLPYMPYGKIYVKYLKYTPFIKEYNILVNKSIPLKEKIQNIKIKYYFMAKFLVSPLVEILSSESFFNIKFFQILNLKFKKTRENNYVMVDFFGIKIKKQKETGKISFKIGK
jgi:lipopolysaccharide biosynthesis glycosyltransferase